MQNDLLLVSKKPLFVQRNVFVFQNDYNKIIARYRIQESKMTAAEGIL